MYNKINHMPKIVVLAMSIVVAMLFYCPSSAFAAASLTLTGGTWAIGTIKSVASANTSSTNWTITNDSGGVETITMAVTVASGTWTARTTNDNNNGVSEFVLRLNTSAGQLITGTAANLLTNWAIGGTYQFGLWFKAPASGTIEESENLTITLTVTSWVPPSCSGYTSDGACWRAETSAVSCTSFCASYGGCLESKGCSGQQANILTAACPGLSQTSFCGNPTYGTPFCWSAYSYAYMCATECAVACSTVPLLGIRVCPCAA